MVPDDKDPLIDSLLEETLGGVTPPDLSSRILQAWRDQQQSPPRLASPPLNVYSEVEPEAPPLAPTVRLPQVSPGLPRGRRRQASFWSLPVIGSLTVAAALLVAIIALRESPVAPDHAVARNEQKKNTKDQQSQPKEVASTDPPGTNQKIAESSSNNIGTQATVTPPKAVEPATSDSSSQVAENDRIRQPSSDVEVLGFINHELHEAWQEHGLKPSAEATDAEWCRRAYLRIIGRIPTVEELAEFTGGKSKEKHTELVDRLLTHEKYAEEFATHWADVWANMLIGPALGHDPKEPASREGLELYLRESFLANKPYDQLATELITATGAGHPGSDGFNGAASFLLAHATDDATVATARVCKVFLGVQLQCVQCHDHPNASLKQQSFWAMNAFFRQMKASGNRNDPMELIDQDYLGQDGRDEEGRVFYELPNGIVKVAEPVFLDGSRPKVTSGRVNDVNRREEFARLVAKSKYFSQATMNRLWSHILGYGFTWPADDLIAREPSHSELLARLSDEFEASGFDLKKAIRWIALSDAFNRSSKVSSVQVADVPESGSVALFSRYYTRQLPVEQVFRSMEIAAKLRRETGAGSSIEQARIAWLAQARKTGDEESPPSSTIIAGSPLVRHATTNAFDNMLHMVTKSDLKFEGKVERLFLAALSRKPTRQEVALAKDLAGINGQNEAAALEDIWWAMLNSNEFMLDH